MRSSVFVVFGVVSLIANSFAGEENDKGKRAATRVAYAKNPTDVAYATAKVTPQTFRSEEYQPQQYLQQVKYVQAPSQQQQYEQVQVQEKAAPIQYSLASDVSSFSYKSPLVSYSNQGLLSQNLGHAGAASTAAASNAPPQYVRSQAPQVSYVPQQQTYSSESAQENYYEPSQQIAYKPRQKVVYQLTQNEAQNAYATEDQQPQQKYVYVQRQVQAQPQSQEQYQTQDYETQTYQGQAQRYQGGHAQTQGQAQAYLRLRAVPVQYQQAVQAAQAAQTAHTAQPQQQQYVKYTSAPNAGVTYA